MNKMTLEQAKELADLWRQMQDMRQASISSMLGTPTNRAYYAAYVIIVERKEALIEEIER